MKTLQPPNYRKMLVGFLFVMAALGALAIRSCQALQRFEETSLRLGTMTQLVLVLSKDDASQKRAGKLFEMAYAEITRLDRIFSRYRTDSEVANINAYPDKEYVLSEELAKVFGYALEVFRQSEGAFDVTVLPLLQVWWSAQQTQRLPEKALLQKIVSYVGVDKLAYDPAARTLQMTKGMQLDLGGIAKGYVIEQIRDVWTKAGVENALINIGGDVWAMGLNEHKKVWRLGIQDPDNQQKLLNVIELSNQGMVTSGDYQRYVTIEGKRYSHIIDPRSGWPVENARSVTLVGQDMMAIDAWATACSVLGPQTIDRFVPAVVKAHYVVVYQDQRGIHVKKSY